MRAHVPSQKGRTFLAYAASGPSDKVANDLRGFVAKARRDDILPSDTAALPLPQSTSDARTVGISEPTQRLQESGEMTYDDWLTVDLSYHPTPFEADVLTGHGEYSGRRLGFRFRVEQMAIPQLMAGQVSVQYSDCTRSALIPDRGERLRSRRTLVSAEEPEPASASTTLALP